MKKRLISNYNLIVFMFFSNITYFNTIGFDFLIKRQKQTIWIGLICLFVVSILLFVLFKTFPNNVNLLRLIRKRYFFRIMTCIYIFINCVMMATFSVFVIKKYFYELENIYIFYIIIVIVAMIVCYQSIKTIIYLSSIIFTFFIAFYLIPLLNGETRNFLYLLPIEINSNLIYTLFLVFLPLDNILIIFYKSQFKKEFSKKTLIITTIFFFTYYLYVIVDAISLLGTKFFENISFGGYYRWRMFSSQSFILSDSIVILSIIIVSTIFRLGFNFNLLRLMLFQKKKISFFIILGLIFLGCILLTYTFSDFILNNLIYIFTLLSLIIIYIYLYILYERRKIVNEQN